MSVKHTTLSQLEKLAIRTKSEIGRVESRVDALETTGGQANILEGVQINGTALDIADKLVNILIATGSTDGTISIAGVEYAVAGLKALAYKSEVSESELAAALKAVINAKAEATDLTALGEKVTTLVGEDANKSVRTISAEEVAKIVDSAPEDYDTLKEIAEYIASDKTEAAQINNAISALQTKLTLGTTGDGGTEYATVKDYVEAVIAGLNMSQYATTEAMNSALENKVDKREGYGLSKNDFTDVLKTKLDGIETATDLEVEAMLTEVFDSAD